MTDAWQSAWVEVLPDFKDFKKSANSEMTGILGVAGDNGGKKAGSGISAGIVGGIAGAVAFGALDVAGDIGRAVGEAIGTGINFALDGIDLASSLAETQSAVEAIFGAESSANLDKWAQNMLSDFGQTRAQALGAAKDFGVFGQAAGLSGADLFNFSTDLTAMASDLASFHNTSVDEAIAAIGAGLRGEAEPLRRFGILMDDAALKAKALELGIYDGNGALSTQQKTLAAQKLILTSAGAAMGDFERTSGGLANQQRILAASVEEAQTNLGTALLPTMLSLVQLANEQLIPALNGLVDEIGPVLADALQESMPAFKELLVAIIPLLPELIRLGVEILPVLIDFLILISPLLIDWAKNQAAITATVGGFFDLLNGDTTLVELGEKLFNMGGSLRDVIVVLAQFVASFGQMPAQVASAVGGLGTTLYTAGQDTIKGFINGVQSMAASLAKSALKVVKDAVNGVKSFLGIASPSKLFAELGGFVGEGFIQGIDGQAAGVSDAMRSMVAVPTVGVSSALGASSGTAAGGGGAFINNGTIQVTDEAALVDEVEKRKRRAYALAGLGGVKVA